MKKYQPAELEPKWQKKWAESKLYFTDLSKPSKKYYILAELAYPSGDLHMGHWFTFVMADIQARFKRMKGFNVIFPNGFDAFGLPAENAAIKRGIHPQDWTMSNIERMKEQFATMGASFDWEKTAITCLPEYYKWNQWIFLQMYKKGLAFRGSTLSNWCPECQTVLANENVEAGKCWRCGSEVVQKEIEQWFLKITDYADKLIWPASAEATAGKPANNIVDWPKSLKEAQNNWIGRSEGTLVKFIVNSSEFIVERKNFTTMNNEQRAINIFTTRADTIFGATFLVISPEHPFVTAFLKCKIDNVQCTKELAQYVQAAKKKSELERKEDKEKTGVFTGTYAKNPLTGENIPIWVADYVLMGYGTGAIMAVPAHDQRDFEFAQKYGLEIKTVIQPVIPGTPPVILSAPPRSGKCPWGETKDIYSSSSTQNDNKKASSSSDGDPEGLLGRWNEQNKENIFEDDGVLINSGEYTGLSSAIARSKITEYLESNQNGSSQVQYHLRDWSISRQRYWGTPIPAIYCRKCWEVKSQKLKVKNNEDFKVAVIDGQEYAIVPVPEKDLPVKLPYQVDYAPCGKAPLATASEWMKVKCPVCGSNAQRETETIDTFVDSSWYFFRYLDPENNQAIFDPQLIADWMPLELYIGGAEHTLGHALYSRFFTKFFHDLGLIKFSEYAQKRVHHGLILGNDGAKMSKSRGNVVDPDKEVKAYGADAVRSYLSFLGPFDIVTPWNPDGVNGIYHFLERVWNLFDKIIQPQLNHFENSICHPERSEGYNLYSSPLAQNDKEEAQNDNNRHPEGAEGYNQHDGSLSLQDLKQMHKTIKKVTEELELIKYNTALAALMSWLNYLSRKNEVRIEEYQTLLKLLAPFAPHLTEELWLMVHSSEFMVQSQKNWSIHQQAWPEYDPKYLEETEVLIIIQVNGKMREQMMIRKDIINNNSDIEKLAKNSLKVQKFLENKQIKQVIYIPGKILNFVTS